MSVVASDSLLENELQALLDRLSKRDRLRSEATLQSDIRHLLLTGGLNLAEHDLDVALETPVGDGRRIDIEVGFTVIEVKKDLSGAAVLRAAEKQLAGYVRTRSEQTGQRYVGILTDGTTWRAYHLRDDELTEATRFELKQPRPDLTSLLTWLEGVLATRKGIPPTPGEIVTRLGAASASYALDRAVLGALYAEHRNLPTVQLKRELWSKLLRSALGTQFTDDDELFLEHTLLVNSAEVIAHLVLGLDVTDMQPATLLAGQRFDLAQIYGVVEADFFDWVLEVPGGDSFVRTMARRLARFDWATVEHDVLKVLYESVIGAETRKRLGEYYTPDWLADQVVAEAVTDPLNQRVLDPSCGSGTFLFHAVRRHLAAADQAGIPLAAALSGLTNRVLGIDLHPVAVALARVTYLLAIGRDRLIDSQRGPITVPVYLGDSVQWAQRVDLFTEGHLLISTGTGSQLFEDELRFPDRLLADAGHFDRLISELASLASKNRTTGTVPPLTAIFKRLAIAEADQPAIKDSFGVLCRLQDEGRDHIWSYYIRNLVRPVWLGRPENRVDVLVGNPPWLSYRHMPTDMQEVFRKMSEARGLWHGKSVATQQDLSGLFVARAIQQYLKIGGSFAFVLPNAALDRGYFAGFRSGKYSDGSEQVDAAFTGSWDLRRIRPHFFPRGGAVVFGRRTDNAPYMLPAETTRWTGTLPRGIHSWEAAAPHLTRMPAALTISSTEAEGPSPYAGRFSNGATIFPRVLFFVRPQPASPLGFGAGRRAVQSMRSSTEKAPWKDLADIIGVVESEFIRPTMLGETVLPYRVLPARESVLPIDGNDLLDSENPKLDLYPGLADWWRSIESLWEQHRSSTRLTLREQLDFRHKLSSQLPAQPLRLLYGKAGMHVAAALVDNPNAIIDHTLYWGTVTNRDEGLYLCAILNNPALTQLVRPLMSYGKDERHIDKHLWKLPIPLYDGSNPAHRRLVELGQAEASLVAELDLDETENFVTLRRKVRQALSSGSHAEEIANIVTELLGG
ncbi:putative type I restriction enzymeP M protein [Nonomuraea coxensis DSM 45129]|uniref:site-specific DNA-methyltransferase (adenine-specific) n=1 Tax=Nonomuraea coxensis DSM 45129 TaxID=1122611 RepID=A0ABX8U964_9ACTN|nr:putative type I restriction enzymeP M protein [Nonomuraea coxensis DSM 45129]